MTSHVGARPSGDLLPVDPVRARALACEVRRLECLRMAGKAPTPENGQQWIRAAAYWEKASVINGRALANRARSNMAAKAAAPAP